MPGTLVAMAPNSPRAGAGPFGFGEAGQDLLKRQLYSKRTFDKEFETAKLGDSLGYLCMQLGYKDPLVPAILAGKSPHVRAFELVNSTKLHDPKYRQELYEGGAKAVDASTDPLILLAKAVDAEARKVRKVLESEYGEPSKQAYDKNAQAKFAALYPGHVIEMINLDNLYGNGGGGIHCVTQQQPVA